MDEGFDRSLVFADQVLVNRRESIPEVVQACFVETLDAGERRSGVEQFVSEMVGENGFGAVAESLQIRGQSQFPRECRGESSPVIKREGQGGGCGGETQMEQPFVSRRVEPPEDVLLQGLGIVGPGGLSLPPF